MVIIGKTNTAGRMSPNEIERFALWLYRCADPAEAAQRCGIPQEEGIRLASSRRVVKKLSSLYRIHEDTLCRARAGLERLAFGQINDAALIVLTADGEDMPDISRADLFSVSELKRVKGGGVEVKFFDRLKAIEQLIALDERITAQNSSEDFLSAFGRAVSGGEDSGE